MCCQGDSRGRFNQERVLELVSLAGWNREASVVVSSEAGDRVGYVVSVVFPGADVSARLLVLEKVFRRYCRYQPL